MNLKWALYFISENFTHLFFVFRLLPPQDKNFFNRKKRFLSILYNSWRVEMDKLVIDSIRDDLIISELPAEVFSLDTEVVGGGRDLLVSSSFVDVLVMCVRLIRISASIISMIGDNNNLSFKQKAQAEILEKVVYFIYLISSQVNTS